MSKYPVADGRDLDIPIDRYLELRKEIIQREGEIILLQKRVRELGRESSGLFDSEDYIAANAVHMALLSADPMSELPRFHGHGVVSVVVGQWARDGRQAPATSEV